MQAVEKLFPGSGIPQLAGKVEKTFNILSHRSYVDDVSRRS
ncbi:unnamed protein product [Penicillium roqueforti FM164]|uniref:Genomic scaffold, ProqFM164S01 n=1 Tax=Penicillium roqueforti (strain FM164) TaxID=1365484 RepID=W6PVL9_PENRF|nr:unnamed protein product [Penicillium roqueforti FM164]